MINSLMRGFIFGLVMVLLVGCGSSNSGGTTTGNPLTEDNSPSGAAAEAVGGALAGSDANQVNFSAKSTTYRSMRVSGLASLICPTFASTDSYCSTSSHTMWLDYAGCSFSSSKATFTGVEALIMTGTQTAACGTFPNPGSGETLYRQYVSAVTSSSPSYLTVKSSYGTTAYVDTMTSNLGNYDSVTISTLVNGGYGSKVTFGGTGGTRDSITVAERVAVTGVFDHTISGNLAISESSSDATRTLNGNITVYHNRAHVTGNAVFTNVVYSRTCCLPTSGKVTTTFARGSTAPNEAGLLLEGKSESLDFTSCGEATYTNYKGDVSTVSLSRCF